MNEQRRWYGENNGMARRKPFRRDGSVLQAPEVICLGGTGKVSASETSVN